MHELTQCEHIEATISKGQLWFAGRLVRQDKTRRAERIMFERLATQGSMESGYPLKHLQDRLQKSLHFQGAISRNRERRKWFVCGMEVKNSQDWVTAAKNKGK